MASINEILSVPSIATRMGSLLKRLILWRRAVVSEYILGHVRIAVAPSMYVVTIVARRSESSSPV